MLLNALLGYPEYQKETAVLSDFSPDYTPELRKI